MVLGKRAPDDDGDGSNNEDNNVAAGAGGGGGSSNRELWLKVAIADVEKQGTCSFVELQSYEQLSWSVVEAELALVAVKGEESRSGGRETEDGEPTSG